MALLHVAVAWQVTVHRLPSVLHGVEKLAYEMSLVMMGWQHSDESDGGENFDCQQSCQKAFDGL